MPSKSRSKQKAEHAALRQRRHLIFRGYCDRIARTHATMLFEDGGAVFAERDGVRWRLHRAVDPTVIWYETWQLLRDTASQLMPPEKSD